MQKITRGIYSAPELRRAGDGYPARSRFRYSQHGTQLSPFLLLDHSGPHLFPPIAQLRGAGRTRASPA